MSKIKDNIETLRKWNRGGNIKFNKDYLKDDFETLLNQMLIEKDKHQSIVANANELCDAIKSLHPNLNMGDKKQERLYMAYHNTLASILTLIPLTPKTP